MPESSLRTLLLRGTPLPPQAVQQALRSKPLTNIEASLGDAAAKQWSRAAAGAGDAIERLLDVDLMQVLCDGWNKYRVLLASATRSRQHPEETEEVALDEHSFKLTYHPTITVTVDGVGRGEVEFELVLNLTLSALILILKNGELTAVRSGECEGDVTLTLDDAKLVDRPLGKVNLPGLMHLGHGIPIET